jgi:hypothetical protein
MEREGTGTVIADFRTSSTASAPLAASSVVAPFNWEVIARQSKRRTIGESSTTRIFSALGGASGHLDEAEVQLEAPNDEY